VPGYIVVQLAGATLAALFLHAVINVSATYGSNYPAAAYSPGDAFLMEGVLTLGLVSVILGTASGAQNLGLFGAIGVGAYIALDPVKSVPTRSGPKVRAGFNPLLRETCSPRSRSRRGPEASCRCDRPTGRLLR
jgi:glycerol uptake facilitator-like aquaporin